MPRLVHTLLIDNYDSYTYNLYQLIAEANGVEPIVVRNNKISVEQVKELVETGRVDNIVISPGPGTPEQPSDIGVCTDVLRQLPHVPILGVCLGHQALGSVHGARVVRAPEPVHGRLSELSHTGHALFRGVPSGPGSGFDVVRYHSLVLDPATLPGCLDVIATTVGRHRAVRLADGEDEAAAAAAAATATGGRDDKNGAVAARSSSHTSSCSSSSAAQQPDGSGGGLIMAVSHRSRPHYGVQFHPESVATRYGVALLHNFRDLTAVALSLALPQRPPAPALALVHPLGNEAATTAADGTPADAATAHARDDWLVGPPGRPFPPRPWPLAANEVVSPTISNGHARPAPPEAGTSGAAAAASSASAASASSAAAATPGHAVSLRLLWRKLGAGLTEVGGSEALYLELFAGGPNTFWLDSAATDRGRFSFMGGRGGALWRRITYRLPPPPAASAGGDAQDSCSNSRSCGAEDGGAGSAPVIGTVTVEAADGSVTQTRSSFFDFLDRELRRHKLAAAECVVRGAAGGGTAAGGASGSVHGSAGRGDCGGGGGGGSSSVAQAAAHLPFNFWGGLVGYLGYELKAECGGRNAWASPHPDACLYLADQMLAADHKCGAIYALALVCDDGGDDDSAAAGAPAAGPGRASGLSWLDDVCDRIEQLAAASTPLTAAATNGTCAHPAAASATPVAQPQNGCVKQVSATPDHAFRLRHPRQSYLSNIAACHAALHAGESYEVCLTTMLERRRGQLPGCGQSSGSSGGGGGGGGGAPDPLAMYLLLRRANPAPYAAWLDFGLHAAGADGARRSTGSSATTGAAAAADTAGPAAAAAAVAGPVLVCSSPERFLRGDRGGLLEARPIKGTAARRQDPEEDRRSAHCLATSEKERAENLMIVDLLRNDLGRVCEVGSVHVPGLMEIESYATVHQMVSTVRGLRAAGASVVDCIRAAFPGGSMTGAPKVRTMEIIDRLEGGPRGVYSGSIGFISFNDTFDLNIVIRTAIVDVPRDAVAIGAGGAIVVQSSEESEFEEMLLKARALLGVVGRLDAAATATSATSSSPQFKLLSTDGAAATTQTTGGGGLDRSLRLAASSAAAFGSAPPAEVRGS